MKADHVRKSIAMQSRCAHLHSELTVAALNAAETGLLRASLNIAKGYSIKGGGLKEKFNTTGRKERDPRRLRSATERLSILGGVTSGCDIATYLG